MYNLRDAQYLVSGSKRVCMCGVYPNIEYQYVERQTGRDSLIPNDSLCIDYRNELFTSTVPLVKYTHYQSKNQRLDKDDFVLVHTEQLQCLKIRGVFCVWTVWSDPQHLHQG